MAKKDLLTSLQKIASESSIGVQVQDQDATKLIVKNETDKLNKIKSISESMYPSDADKRFNYFNKNINLDGFSEQGKQHYWKLHEQLNPKGMEATRQEFINVTTRELGAISGLSAKEFFLRDRIENSPKWAKTVLEPELAKISTTIANANYTKASQVYGKDAQIRINTLLKTAELDPDLASDQHTADLIKLEQLNLLDVADVVNGRVGVYNDQGAFIPSFAVKNRNQVFKNDFAGSPTVAEQLKVKDTVSKYFKDAVENNLSLNRTNVKHQERLSEEEAIRSLEFGDFTIDKWGEAFSMAPERNPMDQIISGLKGEIKSKRVATYQDLAQTIYSALSQYNNLVGEETDGE